MASGQDAWAEAISPPWLRRVPFLPLSPLVRSGAGWNAPPAVMTKVEPPVHSTPHFPPVGQIRVPPPQHNTGLGVRSARQLRGHKLCRPHAQDLEHRTVALSGVHQDGFSDHGHDVSPAYQCPIRREYHGGDVLIPPGAHSQGLHAACMPTHDLVSSPAPAPRLPIA